jgi:hypothetical protein
VPPCGVVDGRLAARLDEVLLRYSLACAQRRELQCSVASWPAFACMVPATVATHASSCPHTSGVTPFAKRREAACKSASERPAHRSRPITPACNFRNSLLPKHH